MSKTYVMIKPDGVQRGLIGRIIQKFEDKGFQICGLKMTMANDEVLDAHYEELKERDFYPQLMDYIKSGPVVCICLASESEDCATDARMVIGATNPMTASNGTIRGDFGQVSGRNLIHGADSLESAEKELGLWFTEEEILSWDSAAKTWIWG